MTKKYVIEAKNTTLHGSLNNEYKLILTIRSATLYRIVLLTLVGDIMVKMEEKAWGHPIIGPIAIEKRSLV